MDADRFRAASGVAGATRPVLYLRFSAFDSMTTKYTSETALKTFVMYMEQDWWQVIYSVSESVSLQSGVGLPSVACKTGKSGTIAPTGNS